MNAARLVVGGSVLPSLIEVIIQQRQSSEAIDEIHSSLCWHVMQPVGVIQLHAQCSESVFFSHTRHVEFRLLFKSILVWFLICLGQLAQLLLPAWLI